MVGLWSNDPETADGKFPVTLRRDGTQVDFGHMLISQYDPGFPVAMLAYADAHERLRSDPQYVADIRAWAYLARDGELPMPPRPSDPTAPRHRTDDPLVLYFARSGYALREFMARCLAVVDDIAKSTARRRVDMYADSVARGMLTIGDPEVGHERDDAAAADRASADAAAPRGMADDAPRP